MSSRAPVSMCLIARDELLLEEALASVRPHVEEVIVVVTCSGDTLSVEAAKRAGADRVEVFEGCNDVPGKDGLIADFSIARNYSFSLATQPWIAWMDADDVVAGIERLPEVLSVMQLTKASGIEVGAQFPYEYNYNDRGACDCFQYRERIVSSTTAFRWMDECHEVLVNVVNNAIVLPKETFGDKIVWKHRREKSPRPAPWAPSTDYPEGIFVHHQGNRYRNLKAGRSSLQGPWGPGVCDEGQCRWEFWRKEDPNRNLRIMRAAYQKKPDSGRVLFYYGQALADSGEFDEAIRIYDRYVDLSAWDDERALACYRVSAIYTSRKDWKQAIAWALRGISVRENWAEGYLYLCRIYYFMARSEAGDQTRNWQRCVHFGNLGLSLPPTSTVLFVNPVDRDFEAHMYLHFAKSHVGDIRGALESADIALKAKPDNTDFLVNKLIFEERLAKDDARASLAKLKAASLKIVEKFNHRRARADTFDLLDRAICDNLPLIPLEESLASVQPKTETNGVSYQPAPGGGLDIVIACGDCWEQWNPKTAKDIGIGGSETAVLEMSKRLRAKGHRVRVFTSCGDPAVYDGVEYRQTAELGSVGNCQVLICWRHASLVDSCQALVKLLWVHDVYAMGANRNNLAKFDRIFALSQWHKQYLVDYHTREHHYIDSNRVFVTRNGLDLKRFDQQVQRDPHKAVYSSSADRGLESLMSMWPAIRAAVPDAKLDIFYGIYNWEKMALANKDAEGLLRIERIKGAVQVLKDSGVGYFGRVNQQDLAKAYLSAGVWTYPTWFTETSSISGMEAHAAGLPMITSPIAALNETVNGRGVMIVGDWQSVEYKDRFVQATVDAMRNTPEDKRRELQEYARHNFSWDGVVLQWEALFIELLSRPQAAAVPVEDQKPKYQPVGAPAYEGVL